MTDPVILKTERFGSRESFVRKRRLTPRGFGELVLFDGDDFREEREDDTEKKQSFLTQDALRVTVLDGE